MNLLSKLSHKNPTPFLFSQTRFETSNTNLPKVNANPDLTKAVKESSQPIWNSQTENYELRNSETTEQKMRNLSYDSVFISAGGNQPLEDEDQNIKVDSYDTAFISASSNKASNFTIAEPAAKEVRKVLDQRESAEQKIRNQSYDSPLISSGGNLPFEDEDKHSVAVSYDTALITPENTESFKYVKPAANETPKVNDQLDPREQELRDASFDSAFISSGYNQPLEDNEPCPYAMRKAIIECENQLKKTVTTLKKLINEKDERVALKALHILLKAENPDLIPDDCILSKRGMHRILNVHADQELKLLERLKETLDTKGDWYNTSIFDEFRKNNPALVPSDLRSFKEAQKAAYNAKLTLLANKE